MFGSHVYPAKGIGPLFLHVWHSSGELVAVVEGSPPFRPGSGVPLGPWVSHPSSTLLQLDICRAAFGTSFKSLLTPAILLSFPLCFQHGGVSKMQAMSALGNTWGHSVSMFLCVLVQACACVVPCMYMHVCFRVWAGEQDLVPRFLYAIL